MSDSQTIEVKRDGDNLIGATDLIYSPDDNGYYFSQADFMRSRGRVSAKTYRSRDAAMKDWNGQRVKWEGWH